MREHLRACLWLLLLTVLLCSVLYPLVLLGIGQGLFPEKAQGSLLRDADGNVMAARWIGQLSRGAEYSQPRPSAADYIGAPSGASNWGANNPQLRERVTKAIDAWRKDNPNLDGDPVPADLVMAS